VKLQLDLLIPPLYLGNTKQLYLRLARIFSGIITIALHLELLLLLIELEGTLGEVVVVGKLELGEAMNLEMELYKMPVYQQDQ